MIQLGSTIKAYRQQHGYTQGDLAKMLDITSSAISGYELGWRYPSLDILVRLADIFETTTDSLLGHKTNLDSDSVVDVSSLTLGQRACIKDMVQMCKDFNSRYNINDLDLADIHELLKLVKKESK